MAKQHDTGPDGIAVVDKPYGISSNGVVGRVRRALGTRKVGHAGTLDPMATGVLVFGVGKGTKLLHYLVGADKSYTATIRLGYATDTDDAMGEVTTWASHELPKPADIHAVIPDFTGPIMQRPSTVSAIKVDGKRAYARARAGEEFELPERPVTIYEYQISKIVPADVDGRPVLDLTAQVRCSTGTYIRALARDLGERFGVGGHLTTLRRTQVGEFNLDQACQPEGQIPLLGLGEVARSIMPHVVLDPTDCAQLHNGRFLDRAGTPEEPVAACDEHGELVAIVKQTKKHLRPVTVFHTAATHNSGDNPQ